MGPIEDFKFDAAILFSDLLFPLEELGTGLVYNPGPKLDLKISTMDDMKRLKQYNFDPDY
jgi:uroporphyrinogen decarboxylase